MLPLLTPKLDVVFKLLFTQDRLVLLDLVNSMLAYPDHLRIQEIEVKNPEILPEELGEKFIILDILAVDEHRGQYDIEMQVQRYSAYPERALYYLSRLYGTQLERGESYLRLTPVIGIHFLDYEHYPQYPDWRFCFELREVQHPELRLSRDFALHLFELPKLRRPGQKDEWGNPVFEWLHFLNHAHEENVTMRTQYTNPSIQRAFDLLERLSADEITRRKAEMREKALKNEVSMLESAREEGVREGILLGMSALLDVKFGADGTALLPSLRSIRSLERLQQINEAIRQAANLSMLKNLVDETGVPGRL